MGWFSRSEPPKNCKDCKNPCKERFEERKKLIAAAREKAAHDHSAAAQNAKIQANRFEKYNNAMPKAKAAKDVYDPGKEPCLRRVTDPEELKKMGLKPSDLRDNKSGFHAEVYKSEWDGSTIVAFQGTDPNSLNDWKTNIDNGAGKATGQYSSAASVGSKMAASGTPFEIAGHSLGGGLAQEAGLAAPGHNVTIFNSAGLNDASLARNGASSWADLDSRTTAFRGQNEFLTGINEDEDPAHQLANAEQLKKEVTGDAGWMNPMKIEGYNTEKNKTAEFKGHQAAFVKQMDALIAKARKDVAAGRDPKLFPRARGQHVDVPGLTTTSSVLNSRLSRLNQHTMDSMLDRMEAQKKADETALKNYVNPPPPPPMPPYYPMPMGI